MPAPTTSKDALNKPAGIAVDDAANEIFVPDGYGTNRIVLFDATTGGVQGGSEQHGTPDSPFASVTCVKIAKDGKVYVCDRGNDRVAVFDKSGKFLKQTVVSPQTKGTGSVWDVALSRDPQQQFLYVADGHDQKVFILRRDTLEIASSFGDGGRYPGAFYAVGSLAVDSHGNVYTGENARGASACRSSCRKRSGAMTRHLTAAAFMAALVTLGVAERALEPARRGTNAGRRAAF